MSEIEDRLTAVEAILRACLGGVSTPWLPMSQANMGNTITSAYTWKGRDKVGICDAAGGSFAIQLPSVNLWQYKPVIHVVKITAGNTVTLTPASGDTINGAASLAMTTQWTAKTLWADGGTNWYVL